MQSTPNLVIKDFMQCIPEAKRHDYELLLLRCNFSDSADPLFPIILFLLFLQDSLADRSDVLAEEFSQLRMALATGQPLPVSPRPSSWSWWKITAIALLVIQVMLGAFGLYRIETIKVAGKTEETKQSQPARSLEIQKINHYWDQKLEHIKENEWAMNLSELASKETIGIFVTAAVIFVMLLLLQIILTLVAVKKLGKKDDDLKDLEEYLKRSLLKSACCEETHHYLDPDIDSLPPKIKDDTAPDIPVADVSGWGEADESEVPNEESTQIEGDETS
jgi:uncharacterized membrane protein